MLREDPRNIQEVRARDGKVIAVIDEGDEHVAQLADDVIRDSRRRAAARAAADDRAAAAAGVLRRRLRGNDVDQPRNLAKTVTVE